MLFKKDILEGIANGTVTLAFRRWRRASVKPGSRLHTPVGLLEIQSMMEVAKADITETDAAQVGYDSLSRLHKELNAFSEEGVVYRIEFDRIGDDPREALREDDHLDEEQLSELRKRLDRLDKARPQGPWTTEFLRIIDKHPGVRAAELAAAIGWETEKLKLNVRKLKNLGLTISLGTGYRISPRGRTYMNDMGFHQGDL